MLLKWTSHSLFAVFATEFGPSNFLHTGIFLKCSKSRFMPKVFQSYKNKFEAKYVFYNSCVVSAFANLVEHII